jgi:hypothetical protein
MALNWIMRKDENGNPMLEAMSCFRGRLWRLRQGLYESRIYWCENHDTMLQDGTAMRWPAELIEQAKIHVQQKDDDKSTQTELYRLRVFVRSFLNPEENGKAVSAYIRDQAREALGMERAESAKSNN